MLPPAPVTFSTTTGLLHAAESLSATRRAVTSGATPGVKPTRIRTVCSGYPACASAFPAAGKTDSAATTAQIAFIGSRKVADSSNGILSLLRRNTGRGQASVCRGQGAGGRRFCGHRLPDRQGKEGKAAMAERKLKI